MNEHCFPLHTLEHITALIFHISMAVKDLIDVIVFQEKYILLRLLILLFYTAE